MNQHLFLYIIFLIRYCLAQHWFQEKYSSIFCVCFHKFFSNACVSKPTVSNVFLLRSINLFWKVWLSVVAIFLPIKALSILAYNCQEQKVIRPSVPKTQNKFTNWVLPAIIASVSNRHSNQWKQAWAKPKEDIKEGR